MSVPMSFDDAPLLLAGALGLLAGLGVSAALAAWRARRAAAAKPRAGAAGAPTAHAATAAAGVARWRLPPTPQAPPLPPAADLLLVDDSAVARAKLRKLFENAGYRVQLASDGVEALALLQQGRYSLMITDLEMPNMDGATLIAACRSLAPTLHMPILAITGHDSLGNKFNECRDISGVHRKPWVDDILLSHVGTLAGTRRMPTPLRVD